MRKRTRWLLGLTTAITIGTNLGVRTQSSPPPVLLVVNSASSNPYGPYLGEILKAEGLNAFSIAQLSTVTASSLAGVQLVVLAETSLTSTQASTLSNFVAGGGRLVAMRPDAQLAPALGLTLLGTSTAEGYLSISPTTAFADGFPATTLPFHGQSQNYTPGGGAAVLATLYSDATTPTPFPAVVRVGRTVTWAYDLARSVAYSRQGDSANAGVDRDGQPPLRTTDIFYNAIDKDRVNIPHADVQMRMLGRVIADLLADTTPLPRLWYFPGTTRTLMVVTSDSHANPQSYFDRVISSVEARGGRASIYIYNGSAPSPTVVQAWRANGHEVGMHPAGFQYSRSLDAAFQAAEDYFVQIGDVLPSPTTRIHQIEWQGWVDAAKIEASYGMTMDTSFYTWGPSVTYPDGHQAHGYINGSGLPMRFVDQTGAIVPVYQQVTSLIDEQLVISDFSEHLTPDQALAVSRQLIDASQAGDYSAITTQFHVDYFGFGEVQPWAEGTMDYAQALSVPMWTTERWLNYTTARAATTMTALSWSAGARQLSFAVGVPPGSEPQSVALPGAFNGFGLTSVSLDGNGVASTQQSITGRATNFLSVGPGSHTVVVTYNTPIPPPEHPPVAVNDTASVTQGNSVTIPVLANDSDIDGDPLTVTSTTSTGGTVVVNTDQTITYTPNPTTCGADAFTYTISDGRGGSATASVSVSVTCLNGQVTHATFADFSASCAIPTTTIVTRVGDGELRLAGNQGDEYSQSTLNPAKWVAGTWSGGTYSPAPSGGVLSLANGTGAYVRSIASLPVTTIDASVRFSGLPWEHVGWGSLNFGGGYAMFSTYNTTTNLFARTSTNGTTEQQTNLGPIPTGFHTYRVTRQAASSTSDTVSYYLDGALVAQHTVGTLAAMYVYQSHNGGTSQTLDIDRIWIYPTYTGTGTYQSCTMDIGHALSSWTTAAWNATVPAGTTLQLRTRTSTDGSTWGGWSAPLTASGQTVTSPPGRFLQYLVELATTDPNQSAVVDSVTISYADNSVPQNHFPIAISDAKSTSEGLATTIAVLTNDSDPDGDPLTITSVTQGAKGTVVIDPGQTITYTPVTGACGDDTFTYTIDDGRGGTASTSVSVHIACVSGQITQGTAAQFGAVCAVPTNTIVTLTGDGEVRLAGTQGDEYVQTALDLTKWAAGTWNGGGYSPTAAAGVLSIADPNGAFVRSASAMPVATIESSIRFTSAPWEHVGWASLDFEGGYAIFSTYNTSTNLFARTNSGAGEQQTNLGPVPAGFHTYRIDRQVTSPSADTVSYYIDGMLAAQHSVGTLTPMYVYQSNNGGGSQTLDIDRIWVYPSYTASGTFQSCTIDGGSGPFSWTTATWNATTPAGVSLDLLTRTSVDGTTWSSWSAPLTASGQTITSPPGQFIQYQLELATTDPNQSPIVDSVSLHLTLGNVDATPPVISSVTASGITGGSAVISWTTDEPATSLVQYGTTPGYGASTNVDAALVTSHVQTLNGLQGGTPYYYRVISRDASGNEADSSNFTFVTGTPALTITDASVTEGNAGSVNATFTVSLSAPSGQTVTVSYGTANGTATTPSDYAAATGTLTFAPGVLSLPVNVAVSGDTLFETNETFVVNLSGATNATIARAQGVGTIVNDDAAPSISIGDVSVSEGNSGTKNFAFTVTLSAASGATTTVGYTTANGTATSGSDYTATSGTVTFPAGSTTQTLNVSVIGDTVSEPNETFLVNLSGATNATIADAQGTGTILNDDAPAISINDVSVTEGNSGTVSATFTVSLSNPTTQTVTVNYATANGTAVAPGDYTSRSGTLTFSSGTTSQTLAISVAGDNSFEANETFVVNLSGANNATIADAQGVGTIVNDDPLPTLSINDVSVSEGNSGSNTATFTVTLSAASSQTVTVAYATANGTATAGSDYTATSGTLSFTAGTTSRTIAVSVTGDTTPEADETFVVDLSAPTNGTIADSQGTGTIQDNDGTMTVTSPTTNVTWTVGSVHAITWTNNLGTTATVRLELSRNGGTTWESINASVQNSSASGGSFNWTVTGPATTSARVRATWNTNTSVTDTSNANFRIQ